MSRVAPIRVGIALACMLLALAVGAGGCQSTSQAERLQVAVAATTTLAETQNALVALHSTGQISTSRLRELKPARDAALVAIDTLEAAALANDAAAFEAARTQFLLSMLKLQAGQRSTTRPAM